MEDQLRGWAMRRGHRKALETRLLRGAELSSVGPGRCAVKRSVNRASWWWLAQSERPSKRSGKGRWRSCWEMEEAMDVEIEIEETEEELEFGNLMANLKRDMEDVTSTCSTATGCTSITDSEAATPACTPWEAAVLRADLIAKNYVSKASKQPAAPKEKKKREKLSEEQRYLASLSQEYSVDLSVDLEASGPFETFRSKFFRENASQFLSQLQVLYNPLSAAWRLRSTPLSSEVQASFMKSISSKGAKKLLMAFHGTSENALASIYSEGLVVPGLENCVKVVHGAAYGIGIYAGRANNAVISWPYTRGERRPMLVCAALDGTEDEVSHHPGFHVFKTNHCVVPLFESTLLPDPQNRSPGVVPAQAVVRPVVVVEVKRKGPGPRTRIPKAAAAPAVVVFLSRRAVKKRRGTSWCG